MTNATRVAGVLEVELDVRGNLSKMVVEDMFKKAIAAAVELPVELVVKLEVSEINPSVQENVSLSEINRSGQENVSLSETNDTLQKNLSSGVRRLQAIQTKWFEVSYEVVVPGHMDADAIIERANRIAVPGSNESKLFRDVLMSTDGVEGVGEIIATVPASQIVATTSAPSNSKEEESSWKAVVIGLSVAVVTVFCLALSAILIKRKMVTDGTNGSPGADVESGHLEPVNPPPQEATQAVTDAARDEKNDPVPECVPVIKYVPVLDDPKPATEVKAPLVDASAAPRPQSNKFAHYDDVVLVEIPPSKGKEGIVKERIVHM